MWGNRRPKGVMSTAGPFVAMTGLVALLIVTNAAKTGASGSSSTQSATVQKVTYQTAATLTGPIHAHMGTILQNVAVAGTPVPILTRRSFVITPPLRSG